MPGHVTDSMTLYRWCISFIVQVGPRGAVPAVKSVMQWKIQFIVPLSRVDPLVYLEQYNTMLVFGT